jgi:hypothetical protein
MKEMSELEMRLELVSGLGKARKKVLLIPADPSSVHLSAPNDDGHSEALVCPAKTKKERAPKITTIDGA